MALGTLWAVQGEVLTSAADYLPYTSKVALGTLWGSTSAILTAAESFFLVSGGLSDAITIRKLGRGGGDEHGEEGVGCWGNISGQLTKARGYLRFS